MNSRLEALIKRGYSKEDVMRLSSFTEVELDRISKLAFEHLKRGCSTTNNPYSIFIGGQPGSGKTVLSMNLKNELKNAIEIGIDNYRMYHPRYLEIEECIKEHWKDRKETVNDTPGNDIADFTHFFAGAMTDKLIEMGKENSYNMIIEWGMREPVGPLKCLRDLKKNNYRNIIVFVSTNKNISYEACVLRSTIMRNSEHIIRKVPKSFHDYSVETLPDSINVIYMNGFEENIIDYMCIVDRKNNELWNNNHIELPGKIFKNNLENDNTKSNNELLSIKTNKEEMIGLKEQIQEIENLKSIIILNPEVISDKHVIK